MANESYVLDVTGIQPVTLSVDDDVGIDFGVGEYISTHSTDYPTYEGPTEFTPSREAQVVETTEHVLLTDIVINPIPSNYGLIQWNGAVLTVS